jgi:hypothetical protein
MRQKEEQSKKSDQPEFVPFTSLSLLYIKIRTTTTRSPTARRCQEEEKKGKPELCFGICLGAFCTLIFMIAFTSHLQLFFPYKCTINLFLLLNNLWRKKLGNVFNVGAVTIGERESCFINLVIGLNLQKKKNLFQLLFCENRRLLLLLWKPMKNLKWGPSTL